MDHSPAPIVSSSRSEADPARLRALLHLPLQAKLLNLGIGGLALEGPHWIGPGQTFTLHLADDGRIVPLSGSIVWSNLRRTRRTAHGDILPIYRSGASFDEVLAEESEPVLEVLHRNGLPAPLGAESTRRFLRFGTRAPMLVTLRVATELRVLQLGRTGMTIESRPLPELHGPAVFEIDPEGFQILLRGCRVARRRRDPTFPVAPSSRVESEIRFCELAPEDEKILEGLLSWRIPRHVHPCRAHEVS